MKLPAKMILRRGASPRGFALPFVLFTLLVLTLLAAAVLTSVYYDGYTMSSSRHQSHAGLNSALGAQSAVARLRAGAINPANLPVCDSFDTCVLAPYMMYDPDSRYVVTVYKRRRQPWGARTFGSENQVQPVVVYSVGTDFPGAGGEINLSYSAVTEVEVVPPAGSGLPPGAGEGGNARTGGG